ncbi:hypothetical protein WMF30_44035 [Sorangium sp. So ce134]
MGVAVLLCARGLDPHGCPGLAGVLLDARGRSAIESGLGAEPALEALAGDVAERDQVDGEGPELARRFYLEKMITSPRGGPLILPAPLGVSMPPLDGAAACLTELGAAGGWRAWTSARLVGGRCVRATLDAWAERRELDPADGGALSAAPASRNMAPERTARPRCLTP